MIELKECLSIYWREMDDEQILFFRFQDTLLLSDALKGIKIWKDLSKETDKDQFNIVWDCRGLTNFEPLARIKLQHAAKDLSHKISNLWVISESTEIIAGINIISLFATIDSHIVKSINDVKIF